MKTSNYIIAGNDRSRGLGQDSSLGTRPVSRSGIGLGGMHRVSALVRGLCWGSSQGSVLGSGFQGQGQHLKFSDGNLWTKLASFPQITQYLSRGYDV